MLPAVENVLFTSLYCFRIYKIVFFFTILRELLQPCRCCSNLLKRCFSLHLIPGTCTFSYFFFICSRKYENKCEIVRSGLKTIKHHFIFASKEIQKSDFDMLFRSLVKNFLNGPQFYMMEQLCFTGIYIYTWRQTQDDNDITSDTSDKNYFSLWSWYISQDHSGK